MPSTPKINFNFINNNVEESSPLRGISTVLARTTKGPVLDPSTLIKGVTQFQRTFSKRSLFQKRNQCSGSAWSKSTFHSLRFSRKKSRYVRRKSFLHRKCAIRTPRCNVDGRPSDFLRKRKFC